jgi:hypothetical protein
MRTAYDRKTVDAPALPPVVEPDWVELITDICQQGVPKKQIAERCDIERQLLYYWLEGKSSPRWRQGQLLIELHKAIVPPKPKSLFGATLCQM